MNQRRIGYLYIVLTALIFSTMEVALKAVTGVFQTLQITAIRFLLAGLFLIPFALRALKKRGKTLRPGDLPYFLLTGLLCVVLGMVCYQLAVGYAPASVVAVLFSCNALFTTLLAGLILKEPLRWYHYAALVLEVLAVLFIVNPLHTTLDPGGVALALVSALLFSLYSIAGRKKSAAYGGIVITCGSILTGSLLLIGLILLGRIPALAHALEDAGLGLFARVPLFEGIPATAWPALLYVALGVSGCGYVCHMLAIEKSSAREAALVYFLKPVLAPLIALLFLHEEIPGNMWIGIALFVAGSAISILPGILQKEK